MNGEFLPICLLLNLIASDEKKTLKAFLLVNKHNLKQNSALGAQYLLGSFAGFSSLLYVFQQCT